MNEVNNMENLEDTTIQAEPSAEQEIDEQESGTTDPKTEQNDNEGSEKEEVTEDSAFLPIRYNHTDMTLSRDEAVKYAQMGKLLSDSGLDIGKLKPIYNQLDYFAAIKGTTPEALIDNLIKSDEEQYRQNLIEKFGEDSDELDILLQAYRDGQKEKYNKILNDRQESEQRAATEKIESNNSRLANEFIALKKEFSNITDIADVPKEVKEMAIKENKDLLSCYLLHKHREETKINAANKTAEDARKAGTGSGASSERQDDGAIAALINGIWH